MFITEGVGYVVPCIVKQQRTTMRRDPVWCNGEPPDQNPVRPNKGPHYKKYHE